MSTRPLRPLAILAALVCTILAGVLTFDYFTARHQATKDDATVLALQKQAREDSGKSKVLYAEQQRITRERDARHARQRVLAWALILAAGLLVSALKPLAAKPPAMGIKQAPRHASEAPAGAEPKQLCPTPAAPPVDLAFVDEVVAREGTGVEAAINILQAIQEHYRYLPDEALQRVCELTEITPAQIAGTSSFYSRFRRGPVGKHIVRVCHGTACHVKGARQISEQLRRDLDIPEGSDTDPQRLFTLEEVACLGCCSLAPVLMVDEHTAGALTPATARDALDAVHPREPA
jgi:NADH:ubiquinone oxidoreductase subunit E